MRHRDLIESSRKPGRWSPTILGWEESGCRALGARNSTPVCRSSTKSRSPTGQEVSMATSEVEIEDLTQLPGWENLLQLIYRDLYLPNFPDAKERERPADWLPRLEHSRPKPPPTINVCPCSRQESAARRFNPRCARLSRRRIVSGKQLRAPDVHSCSE